MEILLIAITWYITKVYYTKKISIKFREDISEYGLIETACVKCARRVYMRSEHMRTPFYCISCK